MCRDGRICEEETAQDEQFKKQVEYRFTEERNYAVYLADGISELYNRVEELEKCKATLHAKIRHLENRVKELEGRNQVMQ